MGMLFTYNRDILIGQGNSACHLIILSWALKRLKHSIYGRKFLTPYYHSPLRSLETFETPFLRRLILPMNFPTLKRQCNENFDLWVFSLNNPIEVRDFCCTVKYFQIFLRIRRDTV
jgi:hypothetical protein